MHHNRRDMSDSDPVDDPGDGESAGDHGDSESAGDASPGEDAPSTNGGDIPDGVHCVACGEVISADADVCPHCGVGQHKLPQAAGPGRAAGEKYCFDCGAVISADADLCPKCGARQGSGGGTEREVAAILAILLGTIGAHRFYLGDTKLGVLYLCLFWTGLPTILGVIEGVIYLIEDDAEFQRKHVRD